MTKEYGVTHFTELHRILHKYFLIWRCQTAVPLFGTEMITGVSRMIILSRRADLCGDL